MLFFEKNFTGENASTPMIMTRQNKQSMRVFGTQKYSFSLRNWTLVFVALSADLSPDTHILCLACACFVLTNEHS